MRKVTFAVIVVLGLATAACTDQMDPLGVTTHPEGWVDPASGDFHGQFVFESVNKAGSCTTCHGATYQGGTSGESCFRCHAGYPHPDGFADAQSGNFHAGFIAEEVAWKISECQSCHGPDYSGQGVAAKNCLTCHTQPEGPEACNTCHGSMENDAPPLDLQNHTGTTATGVGAHQAHLGDSDVTDAFTSVCSHCHVVPESFAAPGHLDDGLSQAEVVFSPLATHDGRLTPVWDAGAATCGSLYCHGAFTFRRDDSNTPFGYADSVIVGNNPLLRWTEVGTGQADCGTCHGLPPQGHVPAPTCNGCHPRVVDANFNIIDKALHINGQIEVF